MPPVDQSSLSVSLPPSHSTAPAPATLPAGALKLPGHAGWVNPQALGWLKEGPHGATGQAIIHAIGAGNIFPQGKSGPSTVFSSPAVSGTDGKTLRPVLSFSPVKGAGDEPRELALDHVQLQRDDGHQEQWSAPRQPASGERAAPPPLAPVPQQGGPASTVKAGPAPRPVALNSVVTRLQNPTAPSGGAPLGMSKKRKNVPSLSAGEMGRANKRTKYADSLPAALQDKKLTFAAQRFGAGSNGVVCGLSVDGQVSNNFVVKTALMQGDRPSEATMDMLRKEIGLNQELGRINSLKPMPGIVVGAGSAELENQLCLILPRVHGGAMTHHIDALYDDCLAGKSSPADFAHQLREQIKPVIDSMAVLHENGFIVNDFNAGNLLHDSTAKHGKLIDFGCAGHTGDFVKPGTVGTIAPERIESSEHAPQSPGPRNRPLMPASDAYSMGCVLHFLVHNRYPTWSDKAAGLSDEQQLHELSASTEAFLNRGSLFPDAHAALNRDLRSTEHPLAEKQLREQLNAAGFYELVEGLTRPDPEKRLTLAQAMDSRFLNPAPAARP
ncbi:protein kinase domain-containing protein [Pseudomonas sp. SDO528_S397]